MSPTRSFADPVIVDSSDEETETADEDHKDDLSPQSPPDHERGHQPLPKSPVYPPPDDSSEDAEFSSIPDLEIPREQMSPVQENLKESDHGTHMMAPQMPVQTWTTLKTLTGKTPLDSNWTRR